MASNNDSPIYLANKEYLNVHEAAYYCGCSPSQFCRKRKEYGLKPIRYMGRDLYRVTDLKASIEENAHE